MIMGPLHVLYQLDFEILEIKSKVSQAANDVKGHVGYIEETNTATRVKRQDETSLQKWYHVGIRISYRGCVSNCLFFSIIVQVLNETVYLHDAEKLSMQKPCKF